MPNTVRNDLHRVDETSFDYVYEENATIELKNGIGRVRCNIYRPKGPSGSSYPVLATYAPYGKDIHYTSFREVPQEHHSPHSAWETPDPGFWTRHGYALVRADEIGSGQSPGVMNTMSRSTSEAFFDIIEWAGSQPWSSGRVGLLGISYYAGSQWRVAARQPKGLACIVPWEGMSDYYRDRCRHGGIYSNTFIKFWWDRQVITNQYGRPGRAARKWGPDTLEGDLSEEELEKNRHDQTIDNAANCFLDDEYYSSRDCDMDDIKVPVLSVGNWGGILLHLRGNVEGYLNAGSRLKYLRFVTGRHDLPFYSLRNVELQMSFLDAFLKDHDTLGWSTGEAPKNNPEAEKAYPYRFEKEWPLPDTNYTKFYLTPGKELVKGYAQNQSKAEMSYSALGDLRNPQIVQFTTQAFDQQTECTGHIVVHLNVSATATPEGSSSAPTDIDLFITLRHLDSNDKEILYTSTVGDPVPITKGWLRVSLRKVNENSPRNTFWHPHRDYLSSDHATVVPGKVYPVDVEVWPTNVVVEKGAKLVLELSSGDTQGAGLFEHNSPEDRMPAKLQGTNHIHFGPDHENWVLMPAIPPR
ncbi:hypothetical protein MMC13_000206 [Lambiella insularis]|nr:hypothetical protein [Lambiella insularis]